VKTYAGHVNNRLCAAAVFAATRGPRPLVAAGSEDGRLCLWDVQTRALVAQLEGHGEAVLAVDAHPSLCVLASGGGEADRSIKLWSDDSGGGGGQGLALLADDA
jgi:COMPASS component SWD3